MSCSCYLEDLQGVSPFLSLIHWQSYFQCRSNRIHNVQCSNWNVPCQNKGWPYCTQWWGFKQLGQLPFHNSKAIEFCPYIKKGVGFVARLCILCFGWFLWEEMGYWPLCRMVKQKHHTARNQSIKNHKNGIKKPLRQRARCMKGVGQSEGWWRIGRPQVP